MYIQDPWITGPNSVNQQLLFKSGSSFNSNLGGDGVIFPPPLVGFPLITLKR